VTEKAKLKNEIRGQEGAKVGYEGSAYGGTKEISVLEPLPGPVGLTKVVSITVHLSPLDPQEPVCYE
jgi:hypothetical protein